VRIAVSADTRNGLDSIVATHFGRCPFFVLIDVEDGKVKSHSVIDNPFYATHEPGQVPQFVSQQGADVMLTGGMGGRAVQFFQQAGVQAVTGASGTVRAALESYLRGDLTGSAPCAESEAHGHG